jgi:hypothetical protein
MAIDTPTLAYTQMAVGWNLTDALWGDTPAMRAAGTKYLPARKGEFEESTDKTNQAYKTRLNETTLVNYFSQAIKGLSGKVFQKPIIIGENVKAKADWWSDIDFAGSNIDDFSMCVFEAGVRHGVTYILVDAPSTEGSDNLAEQRKNNERPYLTHVTADQVIGWKTERVKNVLTLTEVRIKEAHVVTDEHYNQTIVVKIRKIFKNFSFDDEGLKVFTSGCSWEIIRLNDGEEVPESSGGFAVDEIPLIPFYTNRTGFMQAETYFTTLAHLNLQHWQSSSYQRNILNVARVPRFSAFGLAAEEAAKYAKHGVSNGVFSTEKEGRAEWVECKGASIGHGERDLEKTEEQMALLALDPQLKKATGTQLATVANIESSKANSVLQKWAQSLQTAFIKSASVMYQIAGESIDSPQLTVNDEYQAIVNIEDRVKEAREIRAAGDMSRLVFLTELKRIAFYDDDFNIEAEMARLKQEESNTVVLE